MNRTIPGLHGQDGEVRLSCAKMWRCIALLILCFGTVALAHAQAPGVDYARVIEQAVQAQRAGDYPHAVELFRQAHELSPSARTLRGLGVSEFLAGDLVSAIAHLEAALVHPDKPLDGGLRAKVNELLTRARAEVASYEVTGAPEATSCATDNGPLAPLGPTLTLLPGDHTLHIEAPGFVSASLSVHAEAGAHTELPVTLEAVPVMSAPMPEVLPLVAQPAPQIVPLTLPPHMLADRTERPRWANWNHTRVARSKWATLGVGVAALGSAVATALIAAPRLRAVQHACDKDGCTNKQKDHELARRHVPLLRDAFIATSVLGGVAWATSVGLWTVELRTQHLSQQHARSGAALSLTRSF